MLTSFTNAAGNQLALRLARYTSPHSNKAVQRAAGGLFGAPLRHHASSAQRRLASPSGGQRQRRVDGGGGGGGGDVRWGFAPLGSIPIFASAESDTSSDVDNDTTKRDTIGRPLRYPAAERIVAIGDLHGDYDALRRLLEQAELVDEDGTWIGGRAVLVQMGDQLDRGDSERDIYELLFRLQDTAPADGGAVHILIGNHELMNVCLDFRYVTMGGFADFMRPRDAPGDKRIAVSGSLRRLIKQFPREWGARAMALAPGGRLSQELAERAQVAVIVGDNVFVHGGLAPSHLVAPDTDNDSDNDDPHNVDEALQAINEDTSRYLSGESAHLPEVLDGAGGPLWMRTYSKWKIRSCGPECQQLHHTLTMLRAKRMVVGHTVQPMINAACSGQIWRIDTGISSAYNGIAEALEIFPDGRTQIIGPEGVVDGTRRMFDYDGKGGVTMQS